MVKEKKAPNFMVGRYVRGSREEREGIINVIITEVYKIN